MSRASERLAGLLRGGGRRGGGRVEAAAGSTDGATRLATVEQVDADGKTWVRIDGSSVLTPVTKLMDAALGDRVEVKVGGRRGWVTGNVSSPATDDATALIAAEIASEVAVAANATNQHFWSDDAGAHVSSRTVERDGVEVGDDSAGSNVLVNALGLFLRMARANLVSVTEGAVAFWDGLGDAAENLVATFGRAGVTLGRTTGGHATLDRDGLVVRDSAGEAAIALHARATTYGRGSGSVAASGLALPATLSAPGCGTVHSARVWAITSVGSGTQGEEDEPGFYEVTDSAIAYREGDNAGLGEWWEFGEDGDTIVLLDTATTRSWTSDARTTVRWEWGARTGVRMLSVGERDSQHTAGDLTLTAGEGLAAPSRASVVAGTYNKVVDGVRHLLALGNGTDDAHRSNAFSVTEAGDVQAAGALTAKTLNGYTLDIPTANTSDTWVPVMKSTTIQHRAIPTAYNSVPLAVGSGGTGATTAANARSNLGAVSKAGDTMTGQLVTSTGAVAFGTRQANAYTIPGLLEELRYTSGQMGSFSLGTAYTLSGVTVPTGWYNYVWIPHRSGGVDGKASGDNCNHGTLLLCGMTVSAGMYYLRYSSSNAAYLRNLAQDSNTTYSAGTGLSLSGTTFSVGTVPVANGGTGATTAANARSNLGLAKTTTNITPVNSSFGAGGTFNVYSNAIAATVRFAGLKVTNGLKVGEQKQIGTVPSGYRPAHAVNTVISTETAGHNGHVINMSVLPSGAVNLVCKSTVVDASYTIGGCITYLL